MSHRLLDTVQILELESMFRRNLINSLLGFKPGMLLGSQNKTENTNLAIFSQLIHVGATPPLVGLLFRPDSVERHSLDNIRTNKYFSLNSVTQSMAASAHQTSARYPADVSEFDATGLKAIYWPGFPAPLVDESPLKIMLRAEQEIKIEANQTILIIGAVERIALPEAALAPDGFINHASLNHLSVVGLDAYYSQSPVHRFSYAKPDKPLTDLWQKD